MRLSELRDNSLGANIIKPYSTSTARFFIRTSDTGSVTTTGLVLDLSVAPYKGVTGGKPLDATVHPRKTAPPVWQSIGVSIPLELVFHSSGKNTYVEITHKHRSATSGAGSTWATIKTDTKRFKMGTDTDATFHVGVESAVNAMAVQRYYKANVRFFWRTTTDTAAKDTTTSQELICNSPVYRLTGGDQPEASVPKTVI